MHKEYYLKWLTEWFSKSMPQISVAIDADFFAEGALDSFKTLELISAIETEFGIVLDDGALSDARFSTISGLSEILCEHNKSEKIA